MGSSGEFLLTEENFKNGKIKCFLDGAFSIFDYDLKNSLLFSQGGWDLIRRDLILANIDEESIQALENGPCKELIRAFRVRKELIHYKKVCLHLFEEARTIERELKQAVSFFFWYDGDNIREGATAHMKAISTLAKSDLEEEVSPFDLDEIKSAMQNHENNSCSLKDRKVCYVLASGAWMYHRGIMKSLQDARDIAKAICMSPRHPNGEANGDRPYKLRTLPNSMQTAQAVTKAEHEDPLKISRMNKNGKILFKKEEDDNNNNFTKNTTSGSNAMKRISEKVQNELKWSEDAVHFLSLSIAARGGFKALAMIEELSIYNKHLSTLPSRIEDTLHGYRDAHRQVIDEFVSSSNDAFVSDDDLSAGVLRHREIHHLNGILKACKENKRWVNIIESIDFDVSTYDGGSSRLFVASDDASSNSAFVPKGFELGTFVASSRKVLDEILKPTMLRALKTEPWPPTVGSRRTRVLAFDEETLKKSKIGKKKLEQCSVCCGFFDSRWLRHKMCSICETKKRNETEANECFFAGCKAGLEAYCAHHQRCFVCDAPHSCDQCRLSIGNGETVTNLVETLHPTHLLLDFDRTLCSTKSGASPMPMSRKSSKKTSKEGYSHSLDADLRVAVLAQQPYGGAYVITRNSHKSEIETFLEMHGLKELSKNVHVVPKKVTKGAYIRETFASLGDDFLCIFCDDGIRELTDDEWLRSSPRVHRVLFRRY